MVGVNADNGSAVEENPRNLPGLGESPRNLLLEKTCKKHQGVSRKQG